MDYITTLVRRHRIGNRNHIGLIAHRDYLTPVPDSVLLNLANVQQDGGDSHSSKPRSTLFGPLLEQPRGSASGQNKKPLPVEKKVIDPEVVQGWVEKSKDTTQATTTLAALVNLKTSSLRLFPLSVRPEDTISGSGPTSQIVPHDAPHSLEFTYDADAPKVRISLDVYSRKRPDGKSSKTTVYMGVFDGGFGRTLGVEDGAMLELSHILEGLRVEGEQMAGTTKKEPAGEGEAEGATAEGEHHPGLDAGAPAASNALDSELGPHGNNTRRRLSAFAFKRRHQRSDVAGPALRVVDVDAQTEPASIEGTGLTLNGAPNGKKKDDVNVRVSISLEALDEREQPLKVPNIQTTRLVIIRAGHPASESEADTRHWTVQVVRRDAIIGSHTFRLQDIYGLSSASKTPAVPPPEPSSSIPTTYPPAPTVTVPGAHDTTAAENVPSECVLCLSSPREVVLLPCRHLVACKDCALNMVEYGAGGHLIQPTEDTAATNGGEGVEGEGEEGGDGVPPAPATPAAASIPRPSRRRRRAKGWACPVCRQPYTSMLRITTASPSSKPATATPTPIVAPPAAKTNNANAGGLSNMLSMSLSGATRPGFLRGLSRNASASGRTTAEAGDDETDDVAGGTRTSGVDHPLQNAPPASTSNTSGPLGAGAGVESSSRNPFVPAAAAPATFVVGDDEDEGTPRAERSPPAEADITAPHGGGVATA